MDDKQSKYIARHKCAFQGIFKDCHLIAALSSLAWINDNAIKDQKLVKPYSFTFYDPNPDATRYPAGTLINTPMPVTVIVNANIWMDGSIRIWCCSQGCDEIWVAMYEKAFAKFCMFKIAKTMVFDDLKKADAEPRFADLPNGSDWGGNPVMVLKYLTDKTTKKYVFTIAGSSITYRGVNYAGAYALIRTLCDYNTAIGKLTVTGIGKIMNGAKVRVPMGAWTYPDAAAAEQATGVKIAYTDATISAAHCYTILGIYEDSVGRYIVMRNAYGRGDPTLTSLGKGPWIYYEKQYDIGTTCPATDTALKGKSVSFSDVDGIFALDVTRFNNYFEGFGFITK